jgi:hypothetical protein
MDTTSLLWHYTIGNSLRRILGDKAIKPSAAYVSKEAKPVVWFSRNQVWDSGATKGLVTEEGGVQPLTMEELRVHGGGLYRIGVARETAPHNFDEFVRLSGISRAMASELRHIAKNKGASLKEWFASFDPVEQSKWLTLETWENHQWVNSGQGQPTSFDVSPTK